MRVGQAFTVAIGTFVAACGGADREPAVPAVNDRAASGDASDGDPSCPVAVGGTSVSVEDAEGGAALVFTTTGDVAQVRARAREMARIHRSSSHTWTPMRAGDATERSSASDS